MAASSSSSLKWTTSTPLRPCTTNNIGGPKHVTFASNHTSILIPAESHVSPTKPRERARALRDRNATPRKKASRTNKSSSSPTVPGSATSTSRKKKPRLVESGAVRVQIARRTNPRRGGDKLDSHRLIDKGAVRLNVTRHTTPRRLYATRSRIWSPPPSSCSKKRRRAPQSEKLPDRNNAYMTAASNAAVTAADAAATTPSKERSNTYTPAKQRSNAHRGGHKFRAVNMTPNHSTPAISTDTCEENVNESICLEPGRSLSRNLFD
eukprot:CAMPEP_0181083558 /NCGR_PEP_ID=MMETSP1071-20121207/4221_1 /TAXON_ID=35127 /ORGANISM="Thalassiosira sp., Strain NH16" /LENGTH=264 /DNA_ID=CAMNT_0023165223 /DNA_START=256 /DNA_END=1050 /DNA_ORIENTATION=+